MFGSFHLKSIIKQSWKELSFFHNLKFSNFYISTTSWYKPLIFQILIIWSIIIWYLRSTTFGFQDIGIRIFEFVARAQFLYRFRLFYTFYFKSICQQKSNQEKRQKKSCLIFQIVIVTFWNIDTTIKFTWRVPLWIGHCNFWMEGQMKLCLQSLFYMLVQKYSYLNENRNAWISALISDFLFIIQALDILYLTYYIRPFPFISKIFRI